MPKQTNISNQEQLEFPQWEMLTTAVGKPASRKNMERLEYSLENTNVAVFSALSKAGFVRIHFGLLGRQKGLYNIDGFMHDAVKSHTQTSDTPGFFRLFSQIVIQHGFCERGSTFAANPARRNDSNAPYNKTHDSPQNTIANIHEGKALQFGTRSAGAPISDTEGIAPTTAQSSGTHETPKANNMDLLRKGFDPKAALRELHRFIPNAHGNCMDFGFASVDKIVTAHERRDGCGVRFEIVLARSVANRNETSHFIVSNSDEARY